MSKEVGSRLETVAEQEPEIIRMFREVVETVKSNSGSNLLPGASKATGAQIKIEIELENVGKIQVDMRVDGFSADNEVFVAPLAKADRVKKAKELLTANAVYAKGCSELVCAVLGIGYQQANDLMGDNPPSVGSGPTYGSLEPGDIAGWISTTGSGHVAVYIGEAPDCVFIDVREPGARPRSKNGYYNHEMYKAPY